MSIDWPKTWSPHFSFSLAAVLCMLLLVSGVVGWQGVACAEIPLDTIRVDGRLLIVDAQVKFDSVSVGQSSNTRGGLSRTRNRPLMGNPFAMVGLGWGMDQLADDGRAFRSWSQGQNQSIQVQWGMSKIPKRRAGIARSNPFTIEYSLSLEASSMRAMDVDLLPDSLIGFALADMDQSLLAITYSRFPIGVETDTLAISSDRLWLYSATMGFGGNWDINQLVSAHFSAGFSILLNEVQEQRLFEPALDRGYAFEEKSWSRASVLPFLECGLHRKWMANLSRAQGFGEVGIRGRWQPNSPQPVWLRLVAKWIWNHA